VKVVQKQKSSIPTLLDNYCFTKTISIHTWSRPHLYSHVLVWLPLMHCFQSLNSWSTWQRPWESRINYGGHNVISYVRNTVL